MNYLLLGLLVTAFLIIELLCGGTRLVFSLPSYAILSLAALLSAIYLRPEKPTNRLKFCFATSVVFFAYILLRTLVSPVEYLARLDLYMVLAALIVYFLFSLRITSPKLRIVVAAFILLLAVAECVVGTIQFALGKNYMLFAFLPRPDQYGSRASGFYASPNQLAGLLEIALPMGLGITFFSRWKTWGKILAGYACCACIAGLVMTGSRGGYISSSAGIIVFGILSLLLIGRRFQERMLYILAVSLFVVVIGGFGLAYAIKGSDLISSRLTIIGQDEVRGQFAQAAIEQFKLSPLAGTGSRTFLFYGRLFRARGFNRDPVYAHNDYLQLLAEYGVFGMAGFALFLTAHLLNGWKSFHEMSMARSPSTVSGSNSLALNVGALSAVSAYMVHSYFDFNLHIPGNTLLLAFVFGLLATPTNHLRQPGRVKLQSPFMSYITLVLPLLGLWLAFDALPKFRGEFYGEKSSAALREFNLETEGFNYKDAAKFAEIAIGYEKRNPDLYYNLGEAKTGIAESSADAGEKELLYTQALEAYQKGLSLSPQDVRLVLCKGWALDALKRFDEAEPVFLRTLALDPNSGSVRCNYAAHLYKMGNLDEAEIVYKEASDLKDYEAAEYGLKQIAEDRKAGKSKGKAPDKIAPRQL